MQQRYVAVTNRHICYESHQEYVSLDLWREYYDMLRIASDVDRKKCASLLVQINKLSSDESIAFIVLREKDLPLEDYKALAERACDICRANGKKLMIHYYFEICDNQDGIQLPIDRLRQIEITKENRKAADVLQGMLGVSVHSVREALEAQEKGAAYVVAGNIYETDCKKGLAGKGLEYLREICKAVAIPVYAIGGICDTNIDEVTETGAAGGCIMSGAMKL